MTRKQKISLTVLFLLLSAVCVLSGMMIWRELSQQKEEKAIFDTLAELVAWEESDPEEPTEAEHPLEDMQAGDTQDESSGGLAHTRNLTPLFEQNPDCVGWICIPDTEVDYPVMHTPADPQKYLRRDFYGQYSVSGVPFLEGGCSLDEAHLIIYGHNMKNGTMFGTLKKYTKQEYLSEHPSIELETAAGCAVYQVFAVAVVDKTDEWYCFIGMTDEAMYEEQISRIRKKALLVTETVPVYGRQLLTLSTCYGSGSDTRLIVIAMAN